MPELLSILTLWLTVNFGLPAPERPPQVAFVPPAAMAAIRQQRLDRVRSGTAQADTGAEAQADAAPAVHAIYDDQSRTIFLPEGWRAQSPADLSLLVHELVHHLQNLAGLDYACAEARERPAYRAQADWLGLFGRSLESDFAVDPMTLRLRTHCLY